MVIASGFSHSKPHRSDEPDRQSVVHCLQPGSVSGPQRDLRLDSRVVDLRDHGLTNSLLQSEVVVCLSGGSCFSWLLTNGVALIATQSLVDFLLLLLLLLDYLGTFEGRLGQLQDAVDRGSIGLLISAGNTLLST